MKKSEKIKRKINDYLFDHRFLRGALEHLNAFWHAFIAALIFAFGFASFITPGIVEVAGEMREGLHIATGGVSGVSQTIALALKINGLLDGISGDTVSTVISIGYLVINIPILTFAFFKIGKRFAIYSLVNVGLSSFFIFMFTHPEIFHINITQLIAQNPMIYNHELVRVLFGAVTVGVSSALAYRGDVSCGGIDVFSYYFALRKSSSIGKYGILINSVIISSYSILLVISTRGSDWESGVIAFFFSILYLFVANLIIDAINLRNKKIQVQIITNSDYLTPVLIANFPHSATVVNGEGAYSHQARKVIFMVVSSSQVKDVVKLARKVDHNAFITITPLSQVYGNFFIKPVE